VKKLLYRPKCNSSKVFNVSWWHLSLFSFVVIQFLMFLGLAFLPLLIIALVLLLIPIVFLFLKNFYCCLDRNNIWYYEKIVS